MITKGDLKDDFSLRAPGPGKDGIRGWALGGGSHRGGYAPGTPRREGTPLVVAIPSGGAEGSCQLLGSGREDKGARQEDKAQPPCDRAVAHTRLEAMSPTREGTVDDPSLPAAVRTRVPMPGHGAPSHRGGGRSPNDAASRAPILTRWRGLSGRP